MYEDGLCTALKNLHHIFVGDLGLTFHDHLITLNGYNLTGILIDEVLVPALQHAGCQFTANHSFQALLVHLHLLGQVEDLEDILISLKTDGTEQCRYGQLLLTVDIRVHHIINVGSELNPRALERNDTCRIQQCSVCVYALTEEYAR